MAPLNRLAPANIAPVSAVCREREAAANVDNPISTVGVITADRPHLLRRCLTSMLRQFRDGHATARIIVVDGSKRISNEATGRSVASLLAASEGRRITYIGRREAKAIRNELRTSCSDRLLRFALGTDASGNRNLILLLTRGEHVLFVDDDVVCDTWNAASLQQTIAFCGHAEERPIAFFKTRRRVCEAMIPSALDLLSAHQVLLGQSVRSLAAGSMAQVSVAHDCRFMLDAVAGVRTAIVRATFTGLAGDSGWSYPDRLLFSTGRWRSILASSRATYDSALKFREVCKVADHYIVVHHTGCMAGCMGLANTSIVPPFLSVGRNEDGLFGAMLSAIDQRTVYGHLPYAVVHDSLRGSRYSEKPFASASETRAGDLMMQLTAAWSQSARATNPRRRLARLGKCLGDLARLNRREYVNAVTMTILATRQREIAHIETALNTDGTYPTHWQRDLERYADTLLRSLRKPGFCSPKEFHGARSLDERYDKARQFIGLSAELLLAWAELWTTTRAAAAAIEK